VAAPHSTPIFAYKPSPGVPTTSICSKSQLPKPHLPHAHPHHLSLQISAIEATSSPTPFPITSLSLSLCWPHLRSPVHLSTDWSPPPPRPRVHPAHHPESTTPLPLDGLHAAAAGRPPHVPSWVKPLSRPGEEAALEEAQVLPRRPLLAPGLWRPLHQACSDYKTNPLIAPPPSLPYSNVYMCC
jgi:hypothetical protein